MAQILMCKNKQVYNIDSHDILNKALLPGSMQKSPCNDTYRLWIKERYNSGSNTLARLLQGKAFGQGNRPKIDANTFALSLSDCYWIKNDDVEIAFEDVSPYYNDFWTGSGEYTSGSIPTLYVPGAMSKEWLDKEHLKKDGDASALNRELSAIEFCKKCNVPVNDAFFQDNSLIVLNFTSPSIML
ncbi:MAG: hypothetical protein IJ675_07785, partial [Pseudobutyrivibrio sp.]|nr:hypothetical protein [Pseudobutyrivibrio sp.]